MASTEGHGFWDDRELYLLTRPTVIILFLEEKNNVPRSNLKNTLPGSPEIGTAKPNWLDTSDAISGRPEYFAGPGGVSVIRLAVYDGIYHKSPLGWLSRVECSTTKRLPKPNASSPRDALGEMVPTNGDLFGTDIMPTVEMSTMDIGPGRCDIHRLQNTLGRYTVIWLVGLLPAARPTKTSRNGFRNSLNICLLTSLRLNNLNFILPFSVPLFLKVPVRI